MRAALLWGLALATKHALAAEIPRPRGVGPEFAKFYRSPDQFSCISSPAIMIPYTQVNDDYCDCPDGSDEPGTSACSYLSPNTAQLPSIHGSVDANVSVALPGFYCKNKGHNPSYIPFTYVNDGICDYELCCDGSDEWAAVGGVTCPDKCKDIGAEWRKQDEKRQTSLTAAAKRRKELVLEAAKLRIEIEDKIKSFSNIVDSYEVKVAQLEQEKNEVEEREKRRIVKSGGEGGKLGVLSTLTKSRISELAKNLASVRLQRDASKMRLVELEAIMATFKEEYNPNFNDEGVKRAVRRWEEYVAGDASDEQGATNDQDLDEMQRGVDGIDWAEFETSDTVVDDAELLYRYDAYLPKSLSKWLDEQFSTLRRMLEENGMLAPRPAAAGTESRATQEAQARLSASQSELESTKRKLQSEQEDLSKDYGSEDVFRPLKGRCITLDSGEYTYELCWLDQITQRSKKGGASNAMGTFVRFDSVVVDEPVTADGRGLGTGERIVMRYENGQHCWNGPARSTTVVLACAEEEEVWKVAEEEKCVYRMEVGTPAVCEPPKGSGKGIVKDEL